MGTLQSYVTALQARQQRIALKLGSDIRGADKPSRVQSVALVTLLAALVKVLVDKGVITDAELLAGLNAARDDAYADEPANPPATSDDI